MRQKSGAHRGAVLWLTGLSGAGKTTLARALEEELLRGTFHPVVLDGDEVRRGLSADLGFSQEDRRENNRRVAEVARLMAAAGMIVIVALISPYRRDRTRARKVVEAADATFFEIFVDTPLAVCEGRDSKGLYKRARADKIRDFTGVHAPYEKPRSPDVTVYPATDSVSESVTTVFHFFDKITTR
ncbi:MAG TPA: adenylyl-sulfate kinase [Chthoniobacter sp.]|nr:adenylyl-sulfate kinase [Chthoniobacter sp.]